MFFQQLLSGQRGIASPDGHGSDQQRDEKRTSEIPTGEIGGKGSVGQQVDGKNSDRQGDKTKAQDDKGGDAVNQNIGWDDKE